MSLLKVLAFACSLASGHRIQPHSLTNRKLPTRGSSLSVDDNPRSVPSDEKHVDHSPNTSSASGDLAGHSSGKQDAFQSFAHFSSMIQQEMSSGAKLKVAFDGAKSKIFVPEFLKQVPESALVSAFGCVFLVIFWGFWSLTQHFFGGSCPPRKGSRTKYTHNGRVVYEWDQSPKSITIYIRPPKGLTKTDLEISIDSRHLRVGRKGKPSFLTEETFDLVNEQMSSWSLRKNGELQIILRKARRVDWPVVLLHTNPSSNGKSVKESSKKRQAK